MSVFDRISEINSRMQALQNHFSSANQISCRPDAFTGQAQCLNTSSRVTFEQLMKTANAESAPTASNTPYTGGEKQFEGLIKEAADKYSVDEDLIRAVVRQESGFNPNAVSCCGASGLMQLMPETAKDLGVTNITDPRDNLMGGVKYLKQLLDRYDGNKTKALAAYNAGPGNVDKHGGVPPFPETQNYVKNILGMYQDYKSRA